MRKNIIGLCLIAGICSTAIFAGESIIEYQVAKTGGEFYCTASSSTGKASIDTKKVKIKGFCKGQKYVTTNGHIAGMPNAELNKYFFRVEKDFTDTGSVIVHVDGDVTCSEGSGKGRKEYGEDGYC